MRLHDSARKASMRHRLHAAAVSSQTQPQRQLGFQTSQALQQLQTAKHVPQAVAACATLSMCTTYSKECCRLLAGQSAYDNMLDSVHWSTAGHGPDL